MTGTALKGTTPPGTSSEQQAARWVRRMFANIAPKYDLLNHLLSFNIDRRWRKRLKSRLAPVLRTPGAKVLDLCCGTGDVLLDFQDIASKDIASARVFGMDFCHPMLLAAQHKAQRNGFQAPLIEADALQLPLADSALDGISIAFGFRNLANYEAGLKELDRVLKPGGTLAILEFSHPTSFVLKMGYGFYSRIFLPIVGTLVSGSREAYTYLPDSIGKFPEAAELGRMMEAAGFVNTGCELFTGGIAALHIGSKLPPGGVR